MDFLVGNMVFVYEVHSILRLHLISMACILLWSSAVRVRDSQAYRKMDVTRERFSRILKLRKMLLSFKTGFNLVNAAVACPILESISGLEPSLVMTESRLRTSVVTDSLTRGKSSSITGNYNTLPHQVL